MGIPRVVGNVSIHIDVPHQSLPVSLASVTEDSSPDLAVTFATQHNDHTLNVVPTRRDDKKLQSHVPDFTLKQSDH